MSERGKETIEILEAFEPDDLFECALYRHSITEIKNYIEKLEKENEQLRDIKNKAIGHINACKTNLGNYVLSPSEIECLLEILKEEEK